MDLDGSGLGEDLKGVEEREAIIRISSIKKILFSIKEKDLFIFFSHSFIFKILVSNVFIHVRLGMNHVLESRNSLKNLRLSIFSFLCAVLLLL